MPTPSTRSEFLDLLQKSGVCPPETLAKISAHADQLPNDPIKLAAQLVRQGVLTQFQAKLLLAGRYRGFKLGPYVIRDQIGQGGMGVVYLADHSQLRRRVAIKVLSATEGANKVAVERFLREARAAAALDHPSIVKIFDVGQQGTIHYLVMEYVDGQTLDKVVEQAGPIACGRAVEYITQAAAGLQHAFEKGFVHRDIKPANLMLTRDGSVKILDMGLARSFELNDKLTEILDQGAVVGTADYISPEQAMNSPDLDIRADIYSLGATFFTLVTGKPPFEGTTTQKLLQHQMKEPPSITTLDKTFPHDLALVVDRMLQKKPADRFQTPAEVIAALRPWLPNTPNVVAALSRTNLKSPHIRETLAVVTDGTKPLTKRQATPAGRKLPLPLPALIGIGVGAFLLAVVGVATLAGAFSSGGSKPTVPVAGTPVPNPDPTPEPEPPQPEVAPKKGDPKSPPTPPTVVNAPKQEGVVYKLDLTGRAEYSEKGKVLGDPTKPFGAKWMVGTTSGAGQFPPGWQPSTTTPNGDYEGGLDVVSGSLAVGAKTAGPPGTLLSPDVTYTGGRARLTIDYLTAGVSAPVALRFRPTQPKPAEGWKTAELPPTGGEWKTEEVEFDLKGASAGRIEFVLPDDPKAAVWVKGFTAVDPAPPDGKVLFRLDLSKQEPFVMRAARFRPPGGKPTVREISNPGPGRLPPQWYRWIENEETTAEFFADGRPGGMALGVRSVQGPGGVQLNTPEFTARGNRVRVRVLYQTGPTSPGFILRMRPRSGSIYDVATLPPTGGSWRLADVPVDLKGGSTGGLFEIYNGAAGADAALRLREFVVLDPE